MTALHPHIPETSRYAKCIEVSNRIRWDIENDVIRGRHYEQDKKFLPDGLSKVNDINFLTEDEKRFLSQVQGRSYANIFGLVERFICAKIIEVSSDYVLGDQIALQALVGFSEEELKHQEMFRRLEKIAGATMPEGYEFAPDPNEVAKAVLGKSTWAVLALTLHIELFTQAHYKESIEPQENLSGLWKDVFLYHWKEESQHAIMDEMEWIRENYKISNDERDQAVNDLIDLVVAVDGILQVQSEHDANYFVSNCGRVFSSDEVKVIKKSVLKAYRWQYIFSGVQVPRFNQMLARLTTPEQLERIVSALETLK
jgi:hypothetical protein